MKKCVDTADLLSDYLDGALPSDDSAALQAHIGDCPACKAFMESFKVAGNITKAILLKQIPPDFNARLQTFLKARISRN